jgi:hypothetical protein
LARLSRQKWLETRVDAGVWLAANAARVAHASCLQYLAASATVAASASPPSLPRVAVGLGIRHHVERDIV